MSGGDKPYRNYDEVPICSLASLILSEFRDIICFFEDPEEYYKLGEFKEWIQKEYYGRIPAAARSALLEFQDEDELAVLRSCVGRIIEVVSRNRNDCVTVRAVMDREDMHELRAYRDHRMNSNYQYDFWRPLSTSTIDGVTRGWEALETIYLERTGQMRSRSPPRDLRPAPLPAHEDRRQQQLLDIIRQVSQPRVRPLPPGVREFNRPAPRRPVTPERQHRDRFWDHSKRCWSYGEQRRSSTDRQAPGCSSSYDRPPPSRYEVSGQQNRSNGAQGQRSWPPRRYEHSPQRHAVPEHTRQYNGGPNQRARSPERYEQDPRQYNGEQVRRERSPEQYEHSPIRYNAPGHSRQYNGGQSQRPSSPRRYERSPSPGRSPTRQTCFFASEPSNQSYGRQAQRPRSSRRYERSPSPGRSPVRQNRYVSPEPSNQSYGGQARRPGTPRRYENSPPRYNAQNSRQYNGEQVRRAPQRSPTPEHKICQGKRPVSPGGSIDRYDAPEHCYEGRERYENPSPRTPSPTRQTCSEDQAESRGQREMSSDGLQRTPSRGRSEERESSPPPRLPAPIGEPPKVTSDEDDSFDSMDDALDDQMYSSDEYKTSTPNSLSPSVMTPPICSPVIGTPPGLMSLVLPPPTRLTLENLQDIDRISAQVATNIQEKRSRPSSIGTSAPSTESSSAPTIHRLSLCPPPGLEAQFGRKAPENAVQQKDWVAEEFAKSERPAEKKPRRRFPLRQDIVFPWTARMATMFPKTHEEHYPHGGSDSGSLFQFDGLWFTFDHIFELCELCLQRVYYNHEMIRCHNHRCSALYHAKCQADRAIRFANCYVCAENNVKTPLGKHLSPFSPNFSNN